MIDWNWFYSAVAQSAAAIVGIFAAFIITKIVNNQAIFAQRRHEYDALVRETETLREQAEDLQIGKLNEDIRHKEMAFSLPPRSELEEKFQDPKRLEFSPYDNKSAIEDEIWSKIGRDYSKKSLEELKELFDVKIDDPPTSTLEEVVLSHYGCNSPEFKKMGMIDSLRGNIQKHIKHVKDFKQENSENPQSSRLITVSIVLVMILFVVGVIFPLYCLPSPADKSEPLSVSDFIIKVVILTSITGIVVFIMIKFYVANSHLKMKKETIKELEKYTDFSHYSECFKNYDDKNNATNFKIERRKNS